MARLDALYVGRERLALAIDVGAETSAVHVAFLQPGRAPQLFPIDRWPHQSPALCHVPSQIWFSSDSQARSGGSEPGIEDWRLARLFKLHLHARPTVGSIIETIETTEVFFTGPGCVSASRRLVQHQYSAVSPPPLPSGVSLLQVRWT